MKILTFADDTRVLFSITDEDDVKTLQNDLKTIYKWQETNNMQFNSNKFELLRYGKNQHIKESTSYYSPNETRQSEMADLARRATRWVGTLSDGNVHVKFHDDRLRNGGDITYCNFMETRFGDLRP